MASKEATIYILDVGPTLKAKREGGNISRHEETKQVLLALLANKPVLDTNNDLATLDANGADYQFVDVLQPLGIATLDLMKGVQDDIELGETMGDCMDGLIVSLDMMTKFCKKLKYQKKIYIITDASAALNTEGLEHITPTLKEDGIELNVIGTDFDSDGESKPKTTTQAENEEFFKSLCEETSGNIFSLEEATEQLSEFHTKKVKPTAVYRGTLDLGDPESHPDASLSIPVHMYPSTMIMKIPTAKKYSKLSESVSADELPDGHTGNVNLSRAYKLKVTADMADGDADSEDVEVPADSLEKAYMYGKTIVPIRAVDLEAYKLRTAKSLTILGFFKAHFFRREWLLSNIYSVFSAPGDSRALVELSGLLFGLEEKASMALCRYVRAEDAEPKLGILWHHIGIDHKCLYFGQVAFSEDIRRYVFASLSDIQTASGKKVEKHKLLATPESIEACKEFIGALNLKPSEEEEYLRPEETFNPAVQRHKQLVQFRALNPDKNKPLPPLNPILEAQLRPIPELEVNAQPMADNLIRLWDIKKVEQPLKGKRGYQATLEEDKDKDGISAQLSGAGVPGSAASGGSLFDGLTGNKRHKSKSVGMIPFEMSAVREVGTSDPVKDFQAMVRIATIQSQQGVRLAGAGFVTVALAVDQMKAMVFKLISTSFGDQLYEKAIDCLKSLREFLSSADPSLLTAESEADRMETAKERVDTWNSFVKEVKQTCLNTSISPMRTDFWDLIVKNKRELGLLTIDEVPAGASGVSEEEADQFLLETSEDTTAAPAEEGDAPDEDDLLALMD
ncbi:ATP-dependent DNA helicase II subunit 2 [Mortierella antarctica]|nr:ATP-dependent DNA helicase II subunit 2 [Mortierella antarctica]